MEFDFDAWVKLARENPDEFERQRQVALRATIDTAPAEHRKRLEGLQFQIDMERQRSGSALGACIKLNSMMWAGFFRLRKELNGLVEGAAVPNEQPAPKQSADVISMERFASARRASRTGEE